MKVTKKVSAVVLYKENAFKGNDSYNVSFEGDPNRYSYLCQGEPKIKVGDTGPFEITENGSGDKKWWTVKVIREDSTFKGGGFRMKPNHIAALEFSRKMFNSSQKTQDKWDMDRMIKVATFLAGKLKDGYSRDAIETAVTIECASAMENVTIDAKRLVTNASLIQKWISDNE